jgi:hypothetical protein
MGSPPPASDCLNLKSRPPWVRPRARLTLRWERTRRPSFKTAQSISKSPIFRMPVWVALGTSLCHPATAARWAISERAPLERDLARAIPHLARPVISSSINIAASVKETAPARWGQCRGRYRTTPGCSDAPPQPSTSNPQPLFPFAHCPNLKWRVSYFGQHLRGRYWPYLTLGVLVCGYQCPNSFVGNETGAQPQTSMVPCRGALGRNARGRTFVDQAVNKPRGRDIGMRVVFAVVAISFLSTSVYATECHKLRWAERGECYRSDPAFPVRYDMCRDMVEERGYKGAGLKGQTSIF